MAAVAPYERYLQILLQILEEAPGDIPSPWLKARDMSKSLTKSGDQRQPIELSTNLPRPQLIRACTWQPWIPPRWSQRVRAENGGPTRHGGLLSI
jgi:hypothetical protein